MFSNLHVEESIHLTGTQLHSGRSSKQPSKSALHLIYSLLVKFVIKCDRPVISDIFFSDVFSTKSGSMHGHMTTENPFPSCSFAKVQSLTCYSQAEQDDLCCPFIPPAQLLPLPHSPPEC